MGDTRGGASPTREQVREYVLTMLEGLSGLAASVNDLETNQEGTS